MADGSEIRVSDEQRDRAAAQIRDHFAAGRLTDEELGDRLSAVYKARTEGELAELAHDLPALPQTKAEQKAELVARRSQLQRRLLQEAGGGLGGFAICTVIWAVSGANSFFWPIFVVLGTIGLLLRNGWALYGPAPEFDRVEQHLNRRAEEQNARHADRHQRRRDRRR